MVERGGKGRCPNFTLVNERGEEVEGYYDDFELFLLCEAGGDRWVGVHGDEHDYVWYGRTPESVVLAYEEERLEGEEEYLEEERRYCEELLLDARRAEGAEREEYLRRHASCLEYLEKLEREVERLRWLVEGLRSGRIRVRILE